MNRATAALLALLMVATGSVAAIVLLREQAPSESVVGDGKIRIGAVVVRPRKPPPLLGGTVTPEEFGAVGDGRTDDSRALQRAVDAASAKGKVLELSPGTTYLLQRSLLLGSGTHIVGAGPDSVLRFTWTRNTDSRDGFYVGNRDQTDRGNRNIRLQDFRIRGAADGLPQGPNEMQSEPLVPAIRLRLVNRFVIRRLEISHAPGISIIHQGCSNGLIVANLIHHSGRDGINGTWHRRNMTDIAIRRNRIRLIGDDGIAVIGAPGQEPNNQVLPRDIEITKNTIEGWSSNPNGKALGRGIAVLAATYVVVRGNTIERTHSTGILLAPSTRPFSRDPVTNEPWRSSHITITGNVVKDAGRLWSGSLEALDDAGENGITIKEADIVRVTDNVVRNPRGVPVALFDCTVCMNNNPDAEAAG